MHHTSETKKEYTGFVWTDFCDPSRETLNNISEQYTLDIYQIKDSLEKGHLPKYEKQPAYHFLILRAFTSHMQEKATTITELSNKIAFFYNEDKIISVHQKPFSFLQEIGSDFSDAESLLLYIIGKMVDTYRSPLNRLDEKIENFEKIIFLKDYSKVSLENLYYIKTQTRIIKKILQIFQSTINQLAVKDSNKTALQDIKDSLLSLVLNYEEILEDANNLLNTYHSVNSKKSNDVMKQLTVFSAFFLPLTFVVGVYGMNFEYMPEIKWSFGYGLVWLAMGIISLLIAWWFKKKNIF
jgi:magnesium transporter